MLEKDDITVIAGDNDLGTIDWTPKKYTKLLWMIGQNDRRSSEYKFSDAPRQYGLWEQVPANLTYTIGQSQENTDWYYAQTNDGTWTIKFNLDERPTGRVYLTASIAGCASEKATVTVKVNGTQRATWKPGYKDASVYRSAINSGRHYVYTADFLNTGLKVGENTITLQIINSGGKNGILYDCIKLEAGEQVTGINNVSISNRTIAQPVKYLHHGRLVIERGGLLYTVDGKRFSAKQ
jgi:rhamnogalacturonan endolyase